MAVPIKENIAVNIKAAINAITTVYGYNQDLTHTARWNGYRCMPLWR
jgi:hypothetical protein